MIFLSQGLPTLPPPAPTSTIPTATALARHDTSHWKENCVMFLSWLKNRAFGKILTSVGLPSAFKAWLYHVGELAKE